MHVVNELIQQVVDMCLCLSVISLTTCRLENICKKGLHYSRCFVSRAGVTIVCCVKISVDMAAAGFIPNSKMSSST